MCVGTLYPWTCDCEKILDWIGLSGIRFLEGGQRGSEMKNGHFHAKGECSLNLMFVHEL